MKQHLSLTQLAEQLQARQVEKRDFVASTKQLNMTADTNEIELLLPEGPEVLQANDVAHNQIAQRLEIPVKYYDRLRHDAPALLADNVNHWFQTEGDKRLVRTLNGTMRAFLSDRYQRIENEEIAEIVIPELISQEGIRVESCAITEERMYIKAVFTRIEGEVKRGDVVQAGVAISNSEVGRGSVKVEPLIYRLVCTNGMIMQDSKFRARHVGGRLAKDDNIVELLSDEAIQADDRAILLKVRDVVRASFDQARFQQHLQLMQGATMQIIEGNPVEAVKVLAKKLTLSEGEQGGILRHLIEGGDLSRWGIANAVTRTAQDVESYDRATEIESLGSNVLLFPKAEWQQIAQAA